MEQSPSMSRREFTVLSAATAGSVVIPSMESNAASTGVGDPTAAAIEEHTTDLYQFLLEYVEPEFALPTLVRFDDESGLDVLEAVDIQYRTHTGEVIGAHAELTPADATTVMDADATERLEYAPGANPFWKLGAYDERVFPDPEQSVGHIAFDEALAGIEHLQERNPDRLTLETIGEGHGHENVYEGIEDPQDIWLLELTDQTTGSFEDKEKLVFYMSIHGDERAGTEAGLRFIEELLDGDHPDIESLLSEFVLVFVSPNPDGWVVDERVYEDPADPPDFRRFNGADHDLNRQQPTIGWINPSHLPGEPTGSDLQDDTPGVDDDVPDQIARDVPEPLAVVERLRGYEDVAYLVDLHGMYGNSTAVLALGTGGGTAQEKGDQELLYRALENEITEAAGPLGQWEDAFESAADDTDSQYGCDPSFLCRTPEELFAYGTAPDAIGYAASGAVDGWASLPERAGGLGATSITTEIVFSNSTQQRMENTYIPDVTAFHVAAYRAVYRATIEHAADTVETTVETGGRTTAYVGSESLTRQAADLPHVGASAGNSVASGATAPAPKFGRSEAAGTTSLQTERRQFSTDQPTTQTTVSVSESAHTLDVEVRTENRAQTTLRDPDGNGREARERLARARSETTGTTRYTLTHPEPGEWTIETQTEEGEQVEIRQTQLDAQGTPDPEEALGYEQRDYEVTPLAAIESFADATALSVADVREGALVEDGPVYDNLVISHSDGVDDAYVEALGTFVDRGGNLVLTDAGLELATELDVVGLADIAEVTRDELGFANYGREDTRDQSHPLLTDTREFESNVTQTEPWQHPLLGYAPEEVPAYSIGEVGLGDSATVAYEDSGRVRLATMPTETDRVGVHLLGSLLPPASQANLHPFGVADHGITFLGYQLLCNALGYEITVSRNGSQVVTFGSMEGVPEQSDETGGEDDETGGDETGGDGDDAGGEGNESNTSDADGDGPGFGVVSGLTGLGGIGYLLQRQLAADDQDTVED